MREIDYAYIAGVVDSDGNIRFDVTRNKINNIIVEISQSNLPYLEHLQTLMGGGKIYTFSTGNNPHPKAEPYKFRFTGKAAAALLRRITPHLVQKKKEAELALDFYPHIRSTPISEHIKWHTKMKSLRKTRNEF